MSDSILVFRLVDWDRRYETRGTLKRCGARETVPALTDLARIEMQRLLDAPGGFAAFGMWQILWSLAARSQRRGALVVGGVPLTAEELARVARCPVPVVEQALTLLCSPGIGLLEQVPLDDALRPPVIPPAAPRKPKKPPPPLERCPFCQADLTTLVVPPSGGESSDREGPPEGGTTNGRASPSPCCESHSDGQECPACTDDEGLAAELERQLELIPAHLTVPKFDDRGRLVKLEAIREMRKQLEQRGASPDVIAQYLLSQYRELGTGAESPPPETPPRQPVPHYDNRLKSKKQRRQEREMKQAAKRGVPACFNNGQSRIL